MSGQPGSRTLKSLARTAGFLAYALITLDPALFKGNPLMPVF
jgi:hypothetical protein